MAVDSEAGGVCQTSGILFALPPPPLVPRTGFVLQAINKRIMRTFTHSIVQKKHICSDKKLQPFPPSVP